MDRRVQLGANVALVAVSAVFLVHALWPTALPRLGAMLLPALAAVPPPPPPVRPEIPVPAEPVSIAGAPLLGSAAARVVLIEHADFECPSCARFQAGSLQTLEAEYVDTGKVALAFRHLPLPSLHPNAIRAAEAAACAGAQGRFWEMHDILFENRSVLEEAVLKRHAAAAGVDVDAWMVCMEERHFSDAVAADAAAAAQLGVTGTPAFFVGIRRDDGAVRVLSTIRGAAPIGEFRSALDAALAESAGR